MESQENMEEVTMEEIISSSQGSGDENPEVLELPILNRPNRERHWTDLLQNLKTKLENIEKKLDVKPKEQKVIRTECESYSHDIFNLAKRFFLEGFLKRGGLTSTQKEEIKQTINSRRSGNDNEKHAKAAYSYVKKCLTQFRADVKRKMLKTETEELAANSMVKRLRETIFNRFNPDDDSSDMRNMLNYYVLLMVVGFFMEELENTTFFA